MLTRTKFSGGIAKTPDIRPFVVIEKIKFPILASSEGIAMGSQHILIFLCIALCDAYSL